MSEVKKSNTQEAYEVIEQKIGEVNKALKAGNYREVTASLKALKTAEGDYAAFAEREAYDNIETMIDAIKLYEYPVVKHEENKVKDQLMSVSIKTDATANVDLLEFTKAKGLSKEWSYACEKACQMFTLDTAIALGFNEEQVKAICNSIAFSTAAGNYYAHKTDTSIPDPTSNTSLMKVLQEVVSLAIGEDYHCNQWDVRFIKKVFARKGKAALVLACGKPSYFRSILLDVLYRIVTNGTYGITYDIRDAEGKRKETTVFAASQPAPVEEPAPATEPVKAGKGKGKSGKSGK